MKSVSSCNVIEIKLKHMLFGGTVYYPSGGWEDFKGFFDDLESAKNWMMSSDLDCEWAHVVYDGKICAIGNGDEEYSDKWIWKDVT